MRLDHYATPRNFLEALGAWLGREASANNLLLSFAARRAARSATEEGDYYAAACDGETPLAVATASPGGGVLIAGEHSVALAALAEDLAARGWRPQGVVGRPEAVLAFGEAYAQQTACTLRERHRLRHLALTRLPARDRKSGTLRLAAHEDRELVLAWWERFQRETGTPGQVADILAAIEQPLPDRGIVLWCDPAPVSMAAYTLIDPDAARVSLVYTPASWRRHGYAEALVASLSRALMRGHLIDDRPRRACYLTTDANNPVSNAIYERIGYCHEGDMLHLDFIAAGDET